MIKFDVLNRFTGSVQFTAEIDCDERKSRSFKLGLAVRRAVENGASLSGASLSGASLSRADLYGANLSRADLSGASLSRADLSGARLSRASLSGASLSGADLYGANLSRADLSGASLYGADLYGANLSRADLSGAELDWSDLDGVNLDGANLNGANLDGASGINDWVKCIQIAQYPITYTDTVMQIGCQCHLISEWADFDDKRIAEMDGKTALKFWRKYKEWIFKTIELCPAKPTGAEEKK